MRQKDSSWTPTGFETNAAGMSKEQTLFLEWLVRFNPAPVQRIISEQRYALTTGQLGVPLNAEKIALLTEAIGAGLLPQNGMPLASNGAVNTGDSSDQ